MDFLGIGLTELLVIGVLGFLVLGPDRLADMGRFAGRMVAQLLAWQHQSPEAQLVDQIRKDFQQEIIELRDEIVRARQQLDVSAEVQRLRQDTAAALPKKEDIDKAKNKPAAKSTRNGTVPKQTDPLSESEAGTPQSGTPDDDLLAHLLREQEQLDAENLNRTTQPYQHPATTNTVPRTSPTVSTRGTKKTNEQNEQNAQAGATSADTQDEQLPTIQPISASVLSQQESLATQIETLMTDLQALQAQLRQRGLIDPDWQPPSEVKEQTVSS